METETIALCTNVVDYTDIIRQGISVFYITCISILVLHKIFNL